MKNPTHTLVDNLRFTRSGQVWADFLISGIPYGLRPLKEKQDVRDLHQALVRALPGESLWLSVVTGTEPSRLVERMLADVDRDRHPDWLAECEATLESLEHLSPGQRVHWLSIPLGGGPNEVVRRMVGAGFDKVKEAIALPRTYPTREEVDRYRTQAMRAVESVPAPFNIRPATPAQMVWLHLHTLDRGLYADWEMPQGTTDDVTPALIATKSLSALPEPYLDEGARTDLVKGQAFNPFARRVLKVRNPAVGSTGEEASYQALMVVADVPDGGMVFPGAEMLGKLDESGLDVDWAMRLTVRAGRDVLLDNARALRNLNDQFEQRSGSADQGVLGLQATAEALQEFSTIMENNKLEVEASATIIFCVSSSDLDSTTAQATALTDYLSENAQYRLAQPIGHQEALWWAMHPGVPTSTVVREYAQIAPSSSLSALVPFASTALGDKKGLLLGLNIGHGPLLSPTHTCGPATPVMLDPLGATGNNISGSLAVVGDLGSGKTFALKKITGAILDMGGRAVIPDRTHMGEWALWSSSVTNSRVVDIAQPKLSLDPLRLFGRKAGSRMAQNFLTLLVNAAPTSDLGVTLSDVLDEAYLAEHQLTSLGDVLSHLNSPACRLPHAQPLASRINVFARRDLGRAVFDGSLPALEMHEPAIVISTAILQMPSQAELNQSHLFAQLSLEKIFGRATYVLIAELAREIVFADRDVTGAFVVDEAHFVTNNDFGVQTLTDVVHDGRKHNAVALLGGHDAQHAFPSKVLRGLIPNRLLMRHTDADLARNGLEFMGLDPVDSSLVELVTKGLSPKIGDSVPEHRRGEGIMRDSAGQVGRIKVLPPALKARNQAARTGGRQDLVA